MSHMALRGQGSGTAGCVCDQCELCGCAQPSAQPGRAAKVEQTLFYLGSSNLCTARALFQFQHLGEA